MEKVSGLHDKSLKNGADLKLSAYEAETLFLQLSNGTATLRLGTLMRIRRKLQTARWSANRRT